MCSGSKNIQKARTFTKQAPVLVEVLITKSCLTLGPRGLQPARLLCPWDSPDQNTGVGCHSLLQGIFPTPGSNPGLPHCRQILYHLSYQGTPISLTCGISNTIQMHLSMKQKQTHRHREQTCDCQEGGQVGGGMDQEVGISRCKLSYTHTHTHTYTHIHTQNR